MITSQKMYKDYKGHLDELKDRPQAASTRIQIDYIERMIADYERRERLKKMELLPRVIDSDSFFSVFRSLDAECEFCKLSVYDHEWFLISPEGNPIVCSNIEGISKSSWDHSTSLYHTTFYGDGYEPQTMGTFVRDNDQNKDEVIRKFIEDGIESIEKEIRDPVQAGISGLVFSRREICFYTKKTILAEVNKDAISNEAVRGL